MFSWRINSCPAEPGYTNADSVDPDQLVSEEALYALYVMQYLNLHQQSELSNLIRNWCGILICSAGPGLRKISTGSFWLKKKVPYLKLWFCWLYELFS